MCLNENEKLLNLNFYFHFMEELEGKVLRKYKIREVIPISMFNYSTLGSIPLIIYRMCYEIEIDGQPYELITRAECELPEGTKIRIERSGRILKDTYLLYEDKKFSVISLTKKQR
jgi:hypothetical protein